LPAGVGLAGVRPRGGRGRAWYAGVIAVVMVWAGWQLATARMTEDRAAGDRARIRLAGVALGRLAGGPPCTFESSAGFPQIQLASACVGGPIPSGGPSAKVRFLVVPSSSRVPPSWKTMGVVPGTSWRIDERTGGL